MVNLNLLNQTIRDSGMTITFIANKADISRQTLYNKLSGRGEFTVSEMSSIAKVLGLTTKIRDQIFLQ